MAYSEQVGEKRHCPPSTKARVRWYPRTEAMRSLAIGRAVRERAEREALAGSGSTGRAGDVGRVAATSGWSDPQRGTFTPAWRCGSAALAMGFG